MYINNQFSVLGGYRSKEKTLKKKENKIEKNGFLLPLHFLFTLCPQSLSSIFVLNLRPQSLSSIFDLNLSHKSVSLWVLVL